MERTDPTRQKTGPFLAKRLLEKTWALELVHVFCHRMICGRIRKYIIAL
jgi:hypothetical protein